MTSDRQIPLLGFVISQSDHELQQSESSLLLIYIIVILLMYMMRNLDGRCLSRSQWVRLSPGRTTDKHNLRLSTTITLSLF